MREPAVPPEITIVNSKVKANHVEIGQHRANCARNPDARGNARSIEAGADANCGNSMRENRWHANLPLHCQGDNFFVRRWTEYGAKCKDTKAPPESSNES